VLTALLSKGRLQREEAYAIVQRNAMTSWRTGSSLIELLKDDPDVIAQLSPLEIEACFEDKRYLANTDVIFERLEAL
jgi:adenylosuccinate lyase